MALALSCQPGHVAQESGKNQKDGSDETETTGIWKHAIVTTVVKEKSTLASIFDKCKWLVVGEGQIGFCCLFTTFQVLIFISVAYRQVPTGIVCTSQLVKASYLLPYLQLPRQLAIFLFQLQDLESKIFNIFCQCSFKFVS